MSEPRLRQARKFMAHPATPPPAITPPTRLVVSGGAKAQPVTVLTHKPGLLVRVLKGTK